MMENIGEFASASNKLGCGVEKKGVFFTLSQSGEGSFATMLHRLELILQCVLIV